MTWIQKWWGYDWKNRDPWIYQAGEVEKKLRLASLDQKAKASLRYDLLKKKYLNPVLAETGEYLTEDEIKYMIAVSYTHLTLPKNNLGEI